MLKPVWPVYANLGVTKVSLLKVVVKRISAAPRSHTTDDVIIFIHYVILSGRPLESVSNTRSYMKMLKIRLKTN